MNRLAVYLNRERVGVLEQDENGLPVFQYDEQWLGLPRAIPLSRSLPLRPDPFRGKHARPFFAGILPEEDPRKRIAAILGISERNDFAMLERIGGECAGAVSLHPEGVQLPAVAEAKLHELGAEELADVLAGLPRRPLMADWEGVRLSLAGAQGKLPVVVRDGRIYLPLGDTPSTHIIKPEPTHFTGLAVNELFCLRLAEAVGLNVPSVEYGRAGETPYLLVSRYDRTVDADGRVARIHQEDFCQALGFPPERKYQLEGGPLLADCIQLLRDWSTTPVLDIRGFIDGLIFNVLIGNADAHSKNYSLLYPDGKRLLAPFYDLVCTLAWPELSDQFSMRIGGCKTLREITSSHWKKMAEQSGLGWPMIRERIAILCEKTEQKIESVGASLEELNPEMVATVRDTVNGQVTRCG
jgi:serine/threonine-protein kinase HipA